MDDTERGPQGQPASGTWRPTITKGAEPAEPTQGLAGENESVDSNESMARLFDQTVADGEARQPDGVYNASFDTTPVEEPLPRPLVPDEEEPY